MPRNRVIYNSEALFAGQKVGEACYQEDEGVNSIKQLHRVQSANYNFNIGRTDINQYGELAAIDRIITDTPTVALDFSYYLSNFANEEALGLKINSYDVGDNLSVDAFGDDGNPSTALKFFLDGSKDQRNYFIQTSSEGTDAANDQDNRNKAIIGIGNGFLTSYSVEASVGGLPTANVSVEGLNMSFEDGNILKASGYGTTDYVNSWRTSTGAANSPGAQSVSSGVPILYDGSKNQIDFISGLTGDGAAYSGFYHATTQNIRGGGTSQGTSTLEWRHSGVRLPSINPVDGTKSQGVYFLPTASGHAGADTSGILNLSTLRPGDVRMYFRQADGATESSNPLSGYYTGSVGANITGGNNYTGIDLPGAILPTTSGYKRDTADSNDSEGSAAHIQSFSLDFGLSRTPLQRLGVKHAFSREPDFPITVSLSVDAILADLTTGNLADIIECDQSYDVAIEMCAPADCNAGEITHDQRDFDSRTPVCTYVVRNAKLDSQSFSSSIGDNKGVTLDFTAQVGGPNQSGNGVFLHGITPDNYSDRTKIFATSDNPFPLGTRGLTA